MNDRFFKIDASNLNARELDALKHAYTDHYLDGDNEALLHRIADAQKIPGGKND